MVLADRQLGLGGLRINPWALVIAPASASFVPALANQAYTILLCAFCASDYGAPPSSGSTNETTASPSPVHLKVLFPPAPDSASPSDAGGLIPSKTKPIDSIGEKIADANSVVLRKPLVLLVHLLLPGKKDLLGQSGTSRLRIWLGRPYTYT